MSPLFQLVLFNFLFRWPPLFGRTFYSTTGFIQLFIRMATLIWSHFLFNNWFYSTFYSDGCPYLVALFIQQLVLFNFLFRWPPLFGRTFYSTTGFIQLFIRMAALIWSHFLFNNCNTFYSTFIFIQLELYGHPYFILITTDLLFLFFLFFSLEKKVSYVGFEPGTP